MLKKQMCDCTLEFFFTDFPLNSEIYSSYLSLLLYKIV